MSEATNVVRKLADIEREHTTDQTTVGKEIEP
jgi:hypothetical protein